MSTTSSPISSTRRVSRIRVVVDGENGRRAPRRRPQRLDAGHDVGWPRRQLDVAASPARVAATRSASRRPALTATTGGDDAGHGRAARTVERRPGRGPRRRRRRRRPSVGASTAARSSTVRVPIPAHRRRGGQIGGDQRPSKPTIADLRPRRARVARRPAVGAAWPASSSKR